MIIMPDLKTSLLDLLFELKDTDIKLIIGGGFGIFLKIEHVKQLRIRTLLQELPEARSTNDIDLFLRPELLIHSEKLKPMANAFKKLGYRVVAGAEKYQFIKSGEGDTQTSSVKIDILTGPQSYFHNTTVKVDKRRVRPHPSVGIHAHPVDEAVTLEEELLQKTLAGELTSGEKWQAEIFLPHPYTFLMMKLFAFRDRLNYADKEFSRYHALDIYAILATITEEEWRSAFKICKEYSDNRFIKEAGLIVSQYFSGIDRMGIIQLQESHYYRHDFQLNEFISALTELFR